MNHAKSYHTKQQKIILDYMAGSSGYVTASQILSHLKAEGQKVGLTTIYRHLEKFEKDGIVYKIVLDGNSGACYQYAENVKGRLLLKCEDCGGMIPMDCSHMDDLYEHVLREHQFKVNPHRTMFYGVCDDCLAQKEHGNGGGE